MATIVTRAGKGLELTHDEVDANFNNLNSTKHEDGDSPTYAILACEDDNAAITVTSTSLTSKRPKITYVGDSTGEVGVTPGPAGGTYLTNDTSGAHILLKATGSAVMYTAGSAFVPDVELDSSGNLTVTNVLAVSGSIENSAIGSTTPSTGAFTTLSTTGAATLASVDINGGTIDGATIGATTAAAGTFSALTATGAFTSLGIDDNADATAVTIDASENVNLTRGNGDGLGITFGSPTYVAAQTLDWVEKSTSFSPVLSDAATGGNLATVTTTRAYFTRIANMVCVDLEFIGINTAGMTPTNAIYIQGLPFPGSALMTQFCPVAEVVNIAARPATAKQVAINVGAVTYASLTQSGVGGGSATTLVSDLTSGTARFRTVFTYFVD